MNQMNTIRSFSELLKFSSFEERYNYLKLVGVVGESTFGFDRYLNQSLYSSKEWLRVRDRVIVRDNGCDLGIPEYKIFKYLNIHHMNPISIKDIEDGNPEIFDPEFLVCVSRETHLAIHYGDEELIRSKTPINRFPGDTTLWSSEQIRSSRKIKDTSKRRF